MSSIHPQARTTPKTRQEIKDYEPGFIHIDIKYLPQMPNETSRRYLFVAIDRATRWVFLHTYANVTERFTSRDSKPTGKHAFDVACAGIAVEHCLAPPRHPQTNGMVERFNGRISELVK